MLISGKQFRPRLWSVLLTLAAVCGFIGLGAWQLERAAYKAEIIDRYQARLDLPARLFRAGDDISDIEFFNLRLEGAYLDTENFLVDNEIHQGAAGYRLLTPFRLENSSRLILVDRGWLPIGESRQTLPRLKVPVVGEAIFGVASYPNNDGFRYGEVAVTGQWPQLIPYLDLDVIRAQYSSELYPFILRLAPDLPGHYIRDWYPVWLLPEKSRAYAVQWFSFAAVALLLFVILNWRKPR